VFFGCGVCGSFLGQQNCGSSPTNRLQRTAQAGFLLGWGQREVGLARENVVKWGHAVGEVVLGVGLVFGQHLHGPPLKRGVRCVKTNHFALFARWVLLFIEQVFSNILL
jgi:hypothetical protein